MFERLLFHQKCEKATRARINTEPNLLDLVLKNRDQAISHIIYENPHCKSDHIVLQFQYQCAVEKIKYKKTK